MKMYYEHTVAQSLLGIIFWPLQATSSSSIGFKMVDVVGRGVSVVHSGILVGSVGLVGFGLFSPVEAGVLGGLSHSG